MLDVATANLFNMLAPFFPIITGQEASFKRLQDQVIHPAATLASSIQLSSTSYGFFPRFPDPLFTPNWTLPTVNLLGSCTFIDVGSRKGLKADSPITVDKNGHFGDVLMLLEPNLHRIDKSSQKCKLLRQAAFLVDLFEPLKRRS